FSFLFFSFLFFLFLLSEPASVSLTAILDRNRYDVDLVVAEVFGQAFFLKGLRASSFFKRVAGK
ncbi:hypothetical protein, partial [Methanosarcina barkeri]|uniref:hypothetical protein n=1 Tax=Methanosarcina barkeri TaxID=2208 RepID=UPI001FB2D83D